MRRRSDEQQSVNHQRGYRAARKMFEETGCVPDIDGKKVRVEKIAPRAKQYILETIDNPKARYDATIWHSPADREQTAKSREKIEDFVKQNHAQLWIQHDYLAGTRRKIAPAFYD